MMRTHATEKRFPPNLCTEACAFTLRLSSDSEGKHVGLITLQGVLNRPIKIVRKSAKP